MKRLFRMGLICVISCAYASLCRAAFRHQSWGVRATGMGGAFTVLADDSSALFWNPAGTAWVKRGDITFAGSRAFPGLTGININYGFMSLAVPSDYGTFGAAGTSYNADNFMRENVGLLHYSFMLGKHLGLGANLKYLWHGYNINDTVRDNPVFANGTSKSAFTADAGLRLQLTDRLAAGFLGRNLTEPNVGLASMDRVPAEYQAGLSFKPLKSLSVELDGSYRNLEFGTRQDKTDYHFGAENWFFSGRRSSFGLRAGFNSHEVAGGFSLRVNSWSLYSLRLDYTYIYDTGLNISEAVTHQVGLTLYFTPAPEESRVATTQPKTQPKTKSQRGASVPPPFISQKSTVKPKSASPASGKNKKSIAKPNATGTGESTIAPAEKTKKAPATLKSPPRSKRKSGAINPGASGSAGLAPDLSPSRSRR